MLVDFFAGKETHQPNSVAAYDAAHAKRGIFCHHFNAIMCVVATQKLQPCDVAFVGGRFHLANFRFKGCQESNIRNAGHIPVKAAFG